MVPLSRVASRTLTIVMTIALMWPACAAATPTPLEQKQSEAAAARAQLDTLSMELETAGEDLATVRESLDLTNQQIDAARVDATKAEQDLATAKGALGRRVNQAYRIGGVSYVEVLLGSSNFTSFITRLSYFSRIAESDARLVEAVRDARAEVSARQSALSQRLAEQQILEQSAQENAAKIETALSAQETLIASLDSEISTLIAEQREREEAASRAAAREAAAREEAARASSGTPGPVVSGGGSETGSVVIPGAGITRKFDPDALGAAHPEAVDAAKKYLGVPYLWGGSTPDGFDCSGLVQYAYREVGITIPRNSRVQFSSIRGYIPPDRKDLLQPGDLVFFGTNTSQSAIHHVGMYVGGGSFIHAPQTGDVVRYGSLSARKDYVGATRP